MPYQELTQHASQDGLHVVATERTNDQKEIDGLMERLNHLLKQRMVIREKVSPFRREMEGLIAVVQELPVQARYTEELRAALHRALVNYNVLVEKLEAY